MGGERRGRAGEAQEFFLVEKIGGRIAETKNGSGENGSGKRPGNIVYKCYTPKMSTKT